MLYAARERFRLQKNAWKRMIPKGEHRFPKVNATYRK